MIESIMMLPDSNKVLCNVWSLDFYQLEISCAKGVDSAMVLGKLPVRSPTILITVGQGPTALAVGVGGGCLDIFTLIYPFSPLSPSLGDGPI